MSAPRPVRAEPIVALAGDTVLVRCRVIEHHGDLVKVLLDGNRISLSGWIESGLLDSVLRRSGS